VLRSVRPDVRLVDLRGNVGTRIERLREGRFDAILLAMAGLARLGRATEATEALDPRVFVPAPGQGAIALECRDDDPSVRAVATSLDHAPTARAVTAERAFLAALGGGCNMPLGAHAFAVPEGLELVGFVAGGEGEGLLRAERRGEDPTVLGRTLAEDLRGRGADRFLGR
jgi:hydroxymethylbilane synthase